MFFASDNGAGASPKVIAAVAEAFGGAPAMAYGNDAQTGRVEKLFSELFEREVAVFLLTSGTAANALAVSHVTPPWGAVYAHAGAHVHATECGAAEFYGGVKFAPIGGEGGKLDPAVVAEHIGRARRGDPHHSQPATITLTNLTECGTLYRPDEVAAFGALAREHGLALHMDGARFANAVAAAGCTPAAMTWKAGVDVLSFGATKNGAIAAEAVVFFDPARVDGFLYRRMRGGHLLSKMRLVSAQFEAWLGDGHWLELARHANAMARRLAGGLERQGVATAWPVEGNEVFAILGERQAAAVRSVGVAFHEGRGVEFLPRDRALRPGETIARLIPSFATEPGEVDALVAVVAGARLPVVA